MLLLALLLVLSASILGMWTQYSVKAKIAANQAIPNQAGLSGAEIAHMILRQAGLEEVEVARGESEGRDHYDPRSVRLELSPSVFDGRSVAALGIAAHEVGHALQHAEAYGGLTLRNLTVPGARLGNLLGMPLILLGLLFHNPIWAAVGLVFYLGVVVFQFITLPVEINASKRALVSLDNLNLLRTQEEADGATAVLNAAAMTYVAAALAGIATLIFYALSLFGGRRN
ncbi:MAG: zinc metallopeptidase [Planctomycetota bacterium]|nr:zinc metallopeptidase [Planctomycetota bacterium]MDA1112713.1 zinc metallopeptidase [Planctomycetota bacterium]